jgi:hypothetical protein
MCATQHTNTVDTKGQKIGATRAIPLVIDRSIIKKAVQIAAKSPGVLRVLALKIYSTDRQRCRAPCL